MKKILIHLFIVLLISCFEKVYAEEYICAYDFSYKQGVFDWLTIDKSLEFTINPEEKTITYPDTYFDKSLYFMDYYVDEKYTTEYIIEKLNGGCVKNVVVGPIFFDEVYGYALFFEESNFYKLDQVPAGYGLPSKFVDDYQVIGAIKDISYGEYNESLSTGKLTNADFGCTYYDEIYARIEELKCKKSSDCSLNDIQEYNDKKQILKKFCSSILDHANIGTSYCIEPCLKLSEKIASIEGDNSLNNGECGFSERLLAWISNILRWIKYLAPVIVIVIGILDFIKAISSDKEDEIKKAQGRFIKRLIAAALIFIIPLIIEFVLDKMGFGYDSCGLF